MIQVMGPLAEPVWENRRWGGQRRPPLRSAAEAGLPQELGPGRRCSWWGTGILGAFLSLPTGAVPRPVAWLRSLIPLWAGFPPSCLCSWARLLPAQWLEGSPLRSSVARGRSAARGASHSIPTTGSVGTAAPSAVAEGGAEDCPAWARGRTRHEGQQEQGWSRLLLLPPCRFPAQGVPRACCRHPPSPAPTPTRLPWRDLGVQPAVPSSGALDRGAHPQPSRPVFPCLASPFSKELPS